MVLIAFYTAIATSTVAAPIVATLVYPDRMEPRLRSGLDWMAAHGHVVAAAMLLVIAGVIIAAGVGRL